MRKVIIMSGCAGSGKTEYIKTLIEQHRHPDRKDSPYGNPQHYIASADHFFLNRTTKNYEFDPSKLSEAHAQCFKNFIEKLQCGPVELTSTGLDDHPLAKETRIWQNNNLIIFVDNTNTTVEEVSPYILGAQAFGYEAEIVMMVPPEEYRDSNYLLEQYIKKCHARNKHGVSIESIANQFKKFYDFWPKPWWKVSQVETKF